MVPHNQLSFTRLKCRPSRAVILIMAARRRKLHLRRRSEVLCSVRQVETCLRFSTSFLCLSSLIPSPIIERMLWKTIVVTTRICLHLEGCSLWPAFIANCNADVSGLTCYLRDDYLAFLTCVCFLCMKNCNFFL